LTASVVHSGLFVRTSLAASFAKATASLEIAVSRVELLSQPAVSAAIMASAGIPPPAREREGKPGSCLEVVTVE